MALPDAGNPISLQQVNVELGLTATASINMGGSNVRTLFDDASGAISMSDGYGKSNAAYVAATGGTIVTEGDFKVHIFKSSGTFAVSDAGNAAGSNSVSALIVAGGGGANGGQWGGGYSGGGGAGGTQTTTPGVSVQDYTITVGAGGSGINSSGTGSNTVAFGTTNTGGGGGGNYATVGANGGSGGGGGGDQTRSGGMYFWAR